MSISSKTIAGATYEKVRSDILSGVYRPGQRLLEKELAETLNVSRTPVRDTLVRLEQEGLVIIKPHRGVFVRQLTRKDIQDFYQVRTVLEGLGAELAAKNITNEDRNRLEFILDLMARNLEQYKNSESYKEIVEVNDEFHSLIFQIADNDVLDKMRMTLINPIGLIRMTSWLNKDRKIEVFHEHKEITDAIISGNSDIAKIKAEEHIIKAWKSAELNLDNLPDIIE